MVGFETSKNGPYANSSRSSSFSNGLAIRGGGGAVEFPVKFSLPLSTKKQATR